MQDDAVRGRDLADAGGGGLRRRQGGGVLELDGDAGALEGPGQGGGAGAGDAHDVGGDGGDDLVDGAGGEDAAAADDNEVVGGLGHLAHEVGGDEDGAALAGQAPAGLADPLDALGVQAVDGLVEDEDPRVAQQGGGDAQALAHAQAEALDALLGHGRQAGDVEDLVDAAGGDAVGDGELGQVRPGGARAVQALGVQEGADLAQGGGQVLVGAAVDLDAALGGLVQAHDQAHGGGLAGAVGAEEAGDGARLDGEGDAVDGGLGAVALGETGCFDHRGSAHSWVVVATAADEGRRCVMDSG